MKYSENEKSLKYHLNSQEISPVGRDDITATTSKLKR